MKEKTNHDKDIEQVIEYIKKWNAESAKNGLEKYIKTKEDEAEDKGQKKRDYEIVNNMVNQNFTIDIIKELTGLTEEAINKIINSKNK